MSLFLPVMADEAQDFLHKSEEFGRVVEDAESVDQLFDFITAKSVERIKGKDKEAQAKVLYYLQMQQAMAPEEPKILESKIGSDQAVISIGEQEGEMTMSREVEFRKEGDHWKIDLGAFLDQQK